MKKSFTLVVAVVMMTVATLMLQGCNNNEVQPTPALSATATTTATTDPAATSTSTPIVAIPVTTIGWGALSTEQREEIVQIGNSHPFGGTVKLDPKMDEIVSVLFIEDIPSSCPKQTLLEYKYSNGVIGTNKVLIKGHLENIQKVESIPDLLNNGACCFEYGGCIKTYECSEPLPNTKKCVPCEKVKQPKEDCKPCKQGDKIAPGPGKKQGDGAAPATNPNGNNRKIVTDW